MNEWFPSSKLLWLGASVLLVLFQVKDVFLLRHGSPGHGHHRCSLLSMLSSGTSAIVTLAALDCQCTCLFGNILIVSPIVYLACPGPRIVPEWGHPTHAYGGCGLNFYLKLLSLSRMCSWLRERQMGLLRLCLSLFVSFYR